MSYDRADWHYAGDYPADLPPENGATHIGMFLAWAFMNGLEGELHRTSDAEALRKVRAREMRGSEFLLQYCDEKFTDEDLSDEGNAFATDYYASYLDDYTRVFSEHPTVYHVEDSWATYDRIAPVVSRRYEDWKRKRARPWWKFWGG